MKTPMKPEQPSHVCQPSNAVFLTPAAYPSIIMACMQVDGPLIESPGATYNKKFWVNYRGLVKGMPDSKIRGACLIRDMLQLGNL